MQRIPHGSSKMRCDDTAKTICVYGVHEGNKAEQELLMDWNGLHNTTSGLALFHLADSRVLDMMCNNRDDQFSPGWPSHSLSMLYTDHVRSLFSRVSRDPMENIKTRPLYRTFTSLNCDNFGPGCPTQQRVAFFVYHLGIDI